MAQVRLNKPVLIQMLGYPGSGKSYFARQFAEAVGGIHLNDLKVRYDLFDDPQFTEDESIVVDRVIDYLVDEFLLARIPVILDSQLYRKNDRKHYGAIAMKNKFPNLIVWVQTDIDTCFDRASNRDRRKIDDRYAYQLDFETFDEIQNRFQKPTRIEEYTVISGKHLFKTQLSTVKKKLEKMELINTSSTQTHADINKIQDRAKALLGGRVDFNRRKI